MSAPAHRTILHVDMDAFFASVEELDHPEYRGLPVIVGADPREGRGRGVVAACSYAARKFGIHSAMPISEAWKRCPQGIFAQPRMERYSELSRAVFAILRRFTDLVEVVSVDEAFLDVTGSRRLFGDGAAIGREIKRLIREELGLVASVGVAPNKFLAKVASDAGKPDGFVVVEPGKEAAFLAGLPIGRLWGVGEKTEEVLKRRGFRTIGDIARAGPARMRAILGDHGEGLARLALGLDERPLVMEEPPKSIGAETTFDEDTDDGERIRATLLHLCDRVAARLRAHGYEAAGVTLKFRDASFHTLTRARMLDVPSALPSDLYPVILELLDAAGWRKGKKVRLLGITAHRIVPSGRIRQPGLFDGKGEEKRRKVESAVDAIRGRYGKPAIRRAATLRRRDTPGGKD